MIPEKLIKALKSKDNKRFLISSHQNMEGDAIGSQLALAELLKYLKKYVILISPEKIPSTYRFLPGANGIVYRADEVKKDYDVACIVDCTDIERLGGIKNSIDRKKPIINIDHHISNSYFGSINWVVPKASCSGEQIYQLFKRMNIPINKKAALYIYIAILTDTGSFRYSNTTPLTHRIVSELMDKGLKSADIYRRIYEGTKRSHFALLSSVLLTLDMTPDGKIAWIKVTKDMLKTHSAAIEGTEDFINFPRSIKGVKIALAFREIGKEMIKVGFRSNENVDVCKLAKMFGGGGHPQASGCLIKASMGEAEEAVLLAAKKMLKKK